MYYKHRKHFLAVSIILHRELMIELSVEDSEPLEKKTGVH
jgi:hypothetical protein